jgi:hypothetical protein
MGVFVGNEPFSCSFFSLGALKSKLKITISSFTLHAHILFGSSGRSSRRRAAHTVSVICTHVFNMTFHLLN